MNLQVYKHLQVQSRISSIVRKLPLLQRSYSLPCQSKWSQRACNIGVDDNHFLRIQRQLNCKVTQNIFFNANLMHSKCQQSAWRQALCCHISLEVRGYLAMLPEAPQLSQLSHQWKLAGYSVAPVSGRKEHADSAAHPLRKGPVARTYSLLRLCPANAVSLVRDYILSGAPKSFKCGNDIANACIQGRAVDTSWSLRVWWRLKRDLLCLTTLAGWMDADVGRKPHLGLISRQNVPCFEAPCIALVLLSVPAAGPFQLVSVVTLTCKSVLARIWPPSRSSGPLEVVRRV